MNNVSKYQVFVWFHFFKIFKELMIGLIFIDSQTGSRYLLTSFVLIWFTIQKRRGKIQAGDNHVHQGLSKVFVFYTYSSDIVIIWMTLSLLMRLHPRRETCFSLACITVPKFFRDFFFCPRCMLLPGFFLIFTSFSLHLLPAFASDKDINH